MKELKDRNFKVGDFVQIFDRDKVYGVFPAIIMFMDDLTVGVRRLEQSNEDSKIHWTIYAKILTKLTPKQILNQLNLGIDAVNNIWFLRNNHLDFYLPIDGTPLQYVQYLLEEPNTRFKDYLKFTAFDDILEGSITILTHYKKTKIPPMKHYHFAVAQAKVLSKFKLNFKNPIYFYHD